MKREVTVSLVVLAGTIALYLSLSLMEDPRAAIFPRVVIMIMGILSFALLLQSVLTKQKTSRAVLQSDRVEQKDSGQKTERFPFGTLFLCFIIIVVYLGLMERLGFYVSAFLFFVAITLILGRKRVNLRKGAFSVFVAFLFVAVLFVLFSKILLVQTPRGLLF